MWEWEPGQRKILATLFPDPSQVVGVRSFGVRLLFETCVLVRIFQKNKSIKWMHIKRNFIQLA